MISIIEKFDISVFYLINHDLQNRFFDFLMPIMSNVKDFYIPILLFWIYLLTKKSVKHRMVALMIFVLIGGSEFISSDVLKPIFNRPRPYHSISRDHLYDRMHKTWSTTPELKKKIYGKSQSLPSSHATNTFAAAFFIVYFLPKTWPIMYLLAFLVGYSRVYLGVHFPLDVVAGGVVGSLWAYLVAKVNAWLIKLLEIKKSTEN